MSTPEGGQAIPDLYIGMPLLSMRAFLRVQRAVRAAVDDPSKFHARRLKNAGISLFNGADMSKIAWSAPGVIEEIGLGVFRDELLRTLPFVQPARREVRVTGPEQLDKNRRHLVAALAAPAIEDYRWRMIKRAGALTGVELDCGELSHLTIGTLDDPATKEILGACGDSLPGAFTVGQPQSKQ